MILREFVTKSKHFLTLQCKFTPLRSLSLKTEITSKAEEKTPKPKERRFIKQPTIRDLKPFDPNFVINLFKGKLDKEIFEYPIIFKKDELQLVIKHGNEIEDFLSNNSNIKINKDTLKQFKNLELFGLSIPQEYGGAGYSITETKFLIECCSVNPNFGRFIGYCDDVGSRLISTYGTELQKKKYLPRLASGESCITLAYLETGPLIDFSSFEGSVIVDHQNNGFLLNAKKKWVNNAHVADLLLILAKTACINDDEGELSTLGFNFYIAEKSYPGISVHQLKSGCASDFDLFEVDFKNVFIPKENQIGDNLVHGYSQLQNVFAHRQLTDAVICSTLIKRILHSALQYCEEKVINEIPVEHIQHVQNYIACLSAYAYGLESTIYLILARFDTHIEPNLFHEGILVKILAVDMLQLAVQNYIQILGNDSFKKNEILEQALKTLHYCSILDENNTYMKLIISSAGVMNVKPSMVSLVKKLRKKYEYPWEAFKYSMSLKPKKISDIDSKLGIKGELNEILAKKGDILENCLGKLKMGIENHLITSGNLALEDEFALVKYAEMVTYVYALAASLSRASTSYCYDFKNSKNEIDIVQLFGDIVDSKFQELTKEAFYYATRSAYYKEIGKICFENKEYPAEHPLSRSY